jgi:hypothetical protein
MAYSVCLPCLPEKGGSREFDDVAHVVGCHMKAPGLQEVMDCLPSGCHLVARYAKVLRRADILVEVSHLCSAFPDLANALGGVKVVFDAITLERRDNPPVAFSPKLGGRRAGSVLGALFPGREISDGDGEGFGHVYSPST